MSLFKSFSIRTFIVLSLVSVYSTVTFSEEEEADDTVEEVIVTGSRIARAETDGASPVIAITQEDIRATGEMSLAEVLRQSSINSFGSFQPESGSTAQSQATISLRGAGAGRTLVLLDGKRMAGSPSYGGVANNVNSIPFSAVERVEILTDGGSALYGSDALAGVVNVIMRKDFEGAEAFVYRGRPERAGGEQEAFGFTAGLTSDVGNVVISLIIGIILGVVSAYFGGIVDSFIMRVADMVLAMPSFLIALVLLSILGRGLENVVFALVMSQWATFARVIRSSALSEKEKDYFYSARCLCLPQTRIIFGHLLPNCLPPIIVLSTINLAFAITLEASLSFLGVGLPITEPSIGLIISNGYEYIIVGKYWMSLYPGLFLLITVISINIFSDRLRILLNPRLNI